MEGINIISRSKTPLKEFLEEHDYIVSPVKEDLWEIGKDNLEIYLKQEGEILFFELDLGNTDGLVSEKFYRDLLILNTKILPVSLGVDHSGKEEHLILLESRETKNLDDNEILSVFESLIIAYHKVEYLLTQHIKK